MSTLNTWATLTWGRVIFCWVRSFILYWIHLLADQQIHQVQHSDTETWPQVWHKAKRSSLLPYKEVKQKFQVIRSLLLPWLTPHMVQSINIFFSSVAVQSFGKLMCCGYVWSAQQLDVTIASNRILIKFEHFSLPRYKIFISATMCNLLHSFFCAASMEIMVCC